MIEVSPFTIDDASELSQMYYELGGGRITADEIIEKHQNGQNGNELVTVAKIDAHHAGFACTHIYDSICYRKPAAEITEIYVRERFRKRGIGKALIVYLEEQLSPLGLSDIIILTRKNNLEANRLYTSQGYTVKKYHVYKKENL